MSDHPYAPTPTTHRMYFAKVPASHHKMKSAFYARCLDELPGAAQMLRDYWQQEQKLHDALAAEKA